MEGDTYNSYQLELETGYKSQPIPFLDFMHEGFFGSKDCIIRFFNSDAEAMDFYNFLSGFLSTPNIPNPVQLFGNSVVALDATYKSIYSFFSDKMLEHQQTGTDHSLLKFIEKHYKEVFFGAIVAIIDLLRKRFVVKNFRNATTVIRAVDGAYFPCFLDVVSLEDDNQGLVIELIKDVRDVMAEIVGLSGNEYYMIEKHIEDGFPEAILNFLNYATDDYVHLVGAKDPEYVLNDPMIWSDEVKIFRTWCQFMFMEDISDDSPHLRTYFRSFPKNWKEKVKQGSLLDIGLDKQIEKKVISMAKTVIADRIIDGEEKRKTDPLYEDDINFLELYENELKMHRKNRGLDDYEERKGAKYVVRLKRNSSHHYNQIAIAQNQPMQSLKSIIDFVDDAFGFSCSYVFWFFNSIWCKADIDWEYHKDMLKGEKSWQEELDRAREKKLARKRGKNARYQERKRLREASLLLS